MRQRNPHNMHFEDIFNDLDTRVDRMTDDQLYNYFVKDHSIIIALRLI